MKGLRAASERVSPTAYATGYFWYEHGLSHPGLVTAEGQRLGRAFGRLMSGVRRISGVSLEDMMLARHRGIDAVLTRAIEEGRIGQVIEIAAGLSGRGLRFMQRYGDRLTYVETDLPAMAATKHRLLADAHLLRERHRVVEIDALKDRGPDSLAGIAASLDQNRGTAIITEGLLSYLDPGTAAGVWRRIAESLARFPQGLYLSDLYLKSARSGFGMFVFGAVLMAFVRGRMYIHFDTADEAQAGLRQAGFDAVAIHETATLPETAALARTPGGQRVRILEARRERAGAAGRT